MMPGIENHAERIGSFGENRNRAYRLSSKRKSFMLTTPLRNDCP